MKYGLSRPTVRIFGCMVCICLLGMGVFAEERVLFNGRDLAGWDSAPGWWRVEDGALTSESTADKPCKECNYLIWNGGQPSDFELIKKFKKNDWNKYRIICQGPEITLFVNDVLMCQFTDNAAENSANKGVIALQMHPGPPMKVQFKNIILKDLAKGK